MLRRINAVNVCGTISFLSMIAMVGFADGGNYIASVICLVLFAGFAYLTSIMDLFSGKMIAWVP